MMSLTAELRANFEKDKIEDESNINCVQHIRPSLMESK